MLTSPTSASTSPNAKDFITTNPKTVTNAKSPAETMPYCSSKAPKPTAKATRRMCTAARKKTAANVRYGRNAAERSRSSRNLIACPVSDGNSIHKHLYDEMHEKLRRDPNYTRFLTKRRSSRVEPVLGTLINHHNMKRINSRGMAQANKHVLMAALTYNLKKYLKFITRKVHRNAQIMNLPKGKFWFWQNLFSTTSIASI